MEKKKIFTFIISWFVVILIWLLFCYGEVRDAYYSWNEISESFSITDVPVKADNSIKKTDKTISQEKEIPQVILEPAKEQTIRVVLLDDEGSMFHKEIVLGCNKETLKLTEDTSYFLRTDKIKIRNATKSEDNITVLSINKSYGNPVYEGTLEVNKTADGLVLINELPLESYVKGVLPGEMSSGFPLEALKAQAVCARTYAVMKMKEPAYPLYNAAVDDSISSQVYMMQERNEKADQAVEDTKSELLYGKDGQLEKCYYYSTSCGKSATEEVWDIDAIREKEKISIENCEEEFSNYIFSTIDSHLEKDEPFYRWSYKVDVTSDDIYEKCKKRSLCDENYGKIKDIKITCRENVGAAECMEVICEKGTFSIMGEYNIRFVLSMGGEVTLQNGKTYNTGDLLPSAFLTIRCKHSKKGDIIGYEITGGGFGHGIGMSQNGAKYMAKAGNNYVEILQTYYDGSCVK